MYSLRFITKTKHRQWKDITNINNVIYTNSKRVGYMCINNGLFIVRRNIDGKQRVVYSSRNEQDVIDYLEFGQVILYNIKKPSTSNINLTEKEMYL